MNIMNQELLAAGGLPLADLSATRTYRWVFTGSLYSCGFHIVTLSTGSPAGTYSFQGTNDSSARLELDGQTVTPATFPLPVDVVYGDSLTVAGAGSSYVVWTEGLPRWIRAVYTRSSGGTASVPRIYISGRE